MSAPVVQTLDQVMAELAPGNQGQLDVLGKKRGLIAEQAVSQKAGLEGAKVTGFNQINNQATGRGMSFSGIPMDEQAQYLAEKYLPGLAAVDQSVNERNIGLDQEAAKIQSDTRNMAFDTVQGQRKDLTSWQMQQEQFAQTAEQNRLNREFEAKQSAMSRAASAAQSAAPDIAGIGSFLSSKVGKDGKVSPTTWQQAKIQWMQKGGDPSSFTSAFAGYVNQKHYWDYTGSK